MKYADEVYIFMQYKNSKSTTKVTQNIAYKKIKKEPRRVTLSEISSSIDAILKLVYDSTSCLIGFRKDNVVKRYHTM